MFERRLFFHIDWALLTAVMVIVAIGVAMIFSTTYVTMSVGGHAGPQVRTQIYAVVIGLVALIVCLTLDYRMLAEHSLMLYVGLCAALVFVLVKGSTQFGAQRWISIGSFNFQPSEFGRVAVALVLAMFFGENRRGARNTGDLVIGGIFTVVPLLLIAKQPDLGTAVTLCRSFSASPTSRGCGCAWRIALAAVILAVPAWYFALKDYQKARIQTSSIRARSPWCAADDSGADHRRLGGLMGRVRQDQA